MHAMGLTYTPGKHEWALVLEYLFGPDDHRHTPESEGAIYYTKPGENGQAYVASKGSAIPAGDCYVYKVSSISTLALPQYQTMLKFRPLDHSGSSPMDRGLTQICPPNCGHTMVSGLPFKRRLLCASVDACPAGDLNLQYDVETGLVGPVIVYPEGKLNSTIAKHPEFVVYYSSTDETNSWFLNKNIQKYLPDQFNASEAIPAVTGDMTPTIAANSSIWGPINSDVPPTGLSTLGSQRLLSDVWITYRS